MPYKDKEKRRENLRLWRLKNPDKKYKEKVKEYEKNPKRIAYLGSLKRRESRQNSYYRNREYYLKKSRLRAQKPEIKERAKFLKIYMSYGITKEQYNLILNKQNNKCAICEIDFSLLTLRQIHLDHNHETGKVRGILCYKCNLAIGHAKESSGLLKKCADYLDKNNE